MKTIIVVSGLISLLLIAGIATAITSSISNDTKNNDFLKIGSASQLNQENNQDPWDPENDGDHSPCGYECWCYQAVITLDNGQRLDAAVTFVYFQNKTKSGFSDGVSFIRIRHWDRQTGKVYDKFRTDDYPGFFQISKDEMDLIYGDSSAQGVYPDYHFDLVDDKNNILTNLDFHATSTPFWGFKSASDGVVAWGFSGTGKGYFVPTLDITGTITINGTVHKATGIGYFEHDFFWSDFANPLTAYSFKEFLSCTKLLIGTIKWYVQQVIKNSPKVLGSSSFQIDNGDIFGWSWSWVLFDNGWSIVLLRPILLGFSQGISPMLLYLSKDGKNYNEIACGTWKNNELKYMKRADIYIPLKYEISAYKDDVELHLSFTPTTEMTELYNKDWAPSAKAETCTFYCCGDVTGTYSDKNTKVQLKGSYTTEQSRWLTKGLKKNGYLSLEIKKLLPPEGLGISIKIVSHKLGFEKYFKLQLKPTFEINYYVKSCR